MKFSCDFDFDFDFNSVNKKKQNYIKTTKPKTSISLNQIKICSKTYQKNRNSAAIQISTTVKQNNIAQNLDFSFKKKLRSNRIKKIV